MSEMPTTWAWKTINVKNHNGKARRRKFLHFGNLQKIMKSGVWLDVFIKRMYIDAEFEVR